jgi:hypothetical protein
MSNIELPSMHQVNLDFLEVPAFNTKEPHPLHLSVLVAAQSDHQNSGDNAHPDKKLHFLDQEVVGPFG